MRHIQHPGNSRSMSRDPQIRTCLISAVASANGLSPTLLPGDSPVDLICRMYCIRRYRQMAGPTGSRPLLHTPGHRSRPVCLWLLAASCWPGSAGPVMTRSSGNAVTKTNTPNTVMSHGTFSARRVG